MEFGSGPGNFMPPSVKIFIANQSPHVYLRKTVFVRGSNQKNDFLIRKKSNFLIRQKLPVKRDNFDI
jgi:hypothetical protein